MRGGNGQQQLRQGIAQDTSNRNPTDVLVRGLLGQSVGKRRSPRRCQVVCTGSSGVRGRVTGQVTEQPPSSLWPGSWSGAALVEG